MGEPDALVGRMVRFKRLRDPGSGYVGIVRDVGLSEGRAR